MSKLSLKSKFILSFLLVGLLPMLVVGIYTFKKSADSLKQEAFSKLTAVKNIKKDAILRFYEGQKKQVLSLSNNTMIQDAMIGFRDAFKNYNKEISTSKGDEIVFKSGIKDYYFNEFGKKYRSQNGNEFNALSALNKLSSNSISLQYHYISKNPNSLGNKEKLNSANDGTAYSKLHARYHPSIRDILEKFGLYDIFLVDIDSGDIVYSVFKELDFATSLIDGPYSKTNLAQVFKKARLSDDIDSVVFVDFEKYTPSYEEQASFIASPIWVDGKKTGVLVFQLPVETISAIVNERSGMGETGLTYVFGKDGKMKGKLMLPDSLSHRESDSKKIHSGFQINESIANKIIEGENGHGITKNFLGYEVISSFGHLDVLGFKWGIITDISTREAFASVHNIKNALIMMVGISCLTIVFFAFVLSSKLSKKIQSIANILKENAKEVATSSESISTSSSQLSEAATQAASSLQETVSSIDEISSMIIRNADAARNSTNVSSKSSEAASLGKKTVESMIESIHDISKNNDEIAIEMQKNNEDISKIVQVISEIGKKTKVINDIVFQTKLLSFNASVEAARAGEHGKGFAVVAEEVGNLASMSGKAALEITEMLDSSIQQVTDIVENTKKKVETLICTSKEKVEAGTKTAHECGDSLDEILQNVTSVNEIVREIASASSEQSMGVQEVTKALQQLDQTTHQNTSVAQESSTMAKKLKFQADSLNSIVVDLMAVVTGNGSFDMEQEPRSSMSENDTKVIALSRRLPQKTHVKGNTKLKVSGFDTEIPDESDDRFEDL
jgi:methyl-accepting chemotaxis protein